jgi:DNA-directed RNA polymerase subunit beta'
MEMKNLDDDDPKKFVAKIGGDAVKEILKKTNVEELSKTLREAVKVETSQQKKQIFLKD